MPVDFAQFLNIKPSVEAAIVQIDQDITIAHDVLQHAQSTYDFLTTQAIRLRTVLAYLNELTPTV